MIRQGQDRDEIGTRQGQVRGKSDKEKTRGRGKGKKRGKPWEVGAR